MYFKHFGNSAPGEKVAHATAHSASAAWMPVVHLVIPVTNRHESGYKMIQGREMAEKLGAQAVLIYLWHRHLRIGSLPKRCNGFDALMDIWKTKALAFSFQILEPLCVKRCAVGMAASPSGQLPLTL